MSYRTSTIQPSAVAENVLLAMQPPTNYRNILQGIHGIRTNLDTILNSNLADISDFRKIKFLYCQDCRTALANVFSSNIRIIQDYSELFSDNISKENFYQASSNILDKYRSKLGVSELDLQYAVVRQLSVDSGFRSFRQSASRNPDYDWLIKSLSREDKARDVNLWEIVVNYLGRGRGLDEVKESIRKRLSQRQQSQEEEVSQVLRRVDEIGSFIEHGVLQRLYTTKEQFNLRIASYGNDKRDYARATFSERWGQSYEVFYVLYVLGQNYANGINYLNDQNLVETLRSKSLVDMCSRLGVDLRGNRDLEHNLRSKLLEKALQSSSGASLAEVLRDTIDPLGVNERWWERNSAKLAEDLAPLARQAIIFSKLAKENTETPISDEQRRVLANIEAEIHSITSITTTTVYSQYSQLDDIGAAYRAVKNQLDILESHGADSLDPKKIMQLRGQLSYVDRMIQFQETASAQQANLVRLFKESDDLTRRHNLLTKEVRSWIEDISASGPFAERREELEQIKRGLDDCRLKLIAIRYIASTGLTLDTDPSVGTFKTTDYQFQLQVAMQVNQIGESAISQLHKLENDFKVCIYKAHEQALSLCEQLGEQYREYGEYVGYVGELGEQRRENVGYVGEPSEQLRENVPQLDEDGPTIG